MDLGSIWTYIIAILGGGGVLKIFDYFWLSKSAQKQSEHDFIQQLLGRVTELEKRIGDREVEMRDLLIDNGRLQAKVDLLNMQLQTLIAKSEKAEIK